MNQRGHLGLTRPLPKYRWIAAGSKGPCLLKTPDRRRGCRLGPPIRHNEVAAGPREHLAGFPIGVDEREDRPPGAEVFVELVRNLEGLPLGQQQQQIGIFLKAAAGLGRRPGREMDEIAKAESFRHGPDRGPVEQQAIADEIHSDLSWPEPEPAAHLRQSRQEGPGVSAEVQVAGVDDPQGAGRKLRQLISEIVDAA